MQTHGRGSGDIALLDPIDHFVRELRVGIERQRFLGARQRFGAPIERLEARRLERQHFGAGFVAPRLGVLEVQLGRDRFTLWERKTGR